MRRWSRGIALVNMCGSFLLQTKNWNTLLHCSHSHSPSIFNESHYKFSHFNRMILLESCHLLKKLLFCRVKKKTHVEKAVQQCRVFVNDQFSHLHQHFYWFLPAGMLTLKRHSSFFSLLSSWASLIRVTTYIKWFLIARGHLDRLPSPRAVARPLLLRLPAAHLAGRTCPFTIEHAWCTALICRPCARGRKVQ